MWSVRSLQIVSRLGCQVPKPRAGLWVEIALTLALITITTIVLNAGVFWLLLRHTEEERRTDFGIALSTALTAQLEVEAGREDRVGGYRRVLATYEGAGLDVEELYVCDAQMRTLASVAGQAPSVPDAGLRAALYGRQQSVEIIGSRLDRQSVVVTSPVAPKGNVVAALRVQVPVSEGTVPGGPFAFFFAYAGFSGLLIAVFGFSLFRRRLLDPIARIREGALRIAAGDFGHLVGVDGSTELVELSGALNTASSSLDAYRSRTAEQVERLEAANRGLAAAQEALIRSEKLAGVGRLAAGVAHEIGNPLSAVLGYVELLGQGLDDPELERGLIARCHRELGRIQSIVRQLLDYSRTGSGEVRDIDVAAALEEAVATVRPQPRFKGMELRVGVEAALPGVTMEPDKLHQVLVNLLLNACDALRDHPAPAVQLRAERDVEGGVSVFCIDNGPGFDPIALERAFEPFFTTKEVGEGTGLGLATCLVVVERAGGRIQVSNGVGGGAQVWIRLPARGGAAGERTPR